LAKNPKIQGKVLAIVHRAITTHIRQKAKRQGIKASIQPGAVTLMSRAASNQRFGGSLNLNVHFHMLFLEGGYYETHQGPKFWWIPPPSDVEIAALVEQLAKRVIRFLKKKGYFTRAACTENDLDAGLPDEEMLQQELLPELQAASVLSRIALGERKGKRVRRLGALEPEDFQASIQGPLCATSIGFSLHAAVYCAPWERGKLEKLCRYIARPAVAEERLEMKPSGDIILKLKTKYSDGTSHLLFSGLEFVEKLAALVPPPRIHLARYFGCLAPHAKIRSQIVPQKPDSVHETAAEGRQEDAELQTPIEKPAKLTRRIPWVELLARVFAIDMKHCVQCGGDLKAVAAIQEVAAIKKILIHLGLPSKPPDIAPARFFPQMSF